jgi:predicted dehydrogenase
MERKPVAPVLVGRGVAGQAILKSLAIIAQMDPALELLPVRVADRGTPLRSYISDGAANVLFLANPSGLHAKCIAEGARAGFSAIVSDKPVCVISEELPMLRKISIPVAVFHGYRAMWGTRTVKRMIEEGVLGDLFAFESRYWQSSSALMALDNSPEKREWKNDPWLNGPSDVLTDLGSHVADMCLYLMDDKPVKSRCTLSYWNSSAPHRDTHVHLFMEFTGGRLALASISKTVHGATNHFEYTVIGSRGAATWRFLQPDEVEFGVGKRTSVIRREERNPSTGSSPFHGLGWLEGYVEISHQALRQAAGLNFHSVPTLQQSLAAMEVLLENDTASDSEPLC